MATINVRADEETERAIEELTSDGKDRSTAVREAIIYTARVQHGHRLRAEAEELAADPDDRAEMRRVLADMEELRAW